MLIDVVISSHMACKSPNFKDQILAEFYWDKGR